MDPVKHAFDQHFGLSLPADWRERPSGGFEEGGWEMHYVNDDGVLEVYASHRSTNDRLYRVYADGRVELVDAATDGALPEHDRRFYDAAARRGHR